MMSEMPRHPRYLPMPYCVCRAPSVAPAACHVHGQSAHPFPPKPVLLARAGYGLLHVQKHSSPMPVVFAIDWPWFHGPIWPRLDPCYYAALSVGPRASPPQGPLQKYKFCQLSNKLGVRFCYTLLAIPTVAMYIHRCACWCSGAWEPFQNTLLFVRHSCGSEPSEMLPVSRTLAFSGKLAASETPMPCLASCNGQMQDPLGTLGRRDSVCLP
jgi:hypothetical protein